MEQEITQETQIDSKVRIVTIICLTCIAIVAIIGITLTAIFTDRDVHYAEGLTFGGIVFIAVIGGFTLRQIRKHSKWKIERENGL